MEEWRSFGHTFAGITRKLVVFVDVFVLTLVVVVVAAAASVHRGRPF